MSEGHRRKSAPTGVAAPCGRGLADRKDTDRLMVIITDPTDPSSTCTDPHVDGCPSCVVNMETPEEFIRKKGSCIATYLCTDCGHRWTTSWSAC